KRLLGNFTGHAANRLPRRSGLAWSGGDAAPKDGGPKGLTPQCCLQLENVETPVYKLSRVPLTISLMRAWLQTLRSSAKYRVTRVGFLFTMAVALIGAAAVASANNLLFLVVATMLS